MINTYGSEAYVGYMIKEKTQSITNHLSWLKLYINTKKPFTAEDKCKMMDSVVIISPKKSYSYAGNRNSTLTCSVPQANIVAYDKNDTWKNWVTTDKYYPASHCACKPICVLK